MYYSNTKLQQELNFIDGKKEGRQYSWLSNGNKWNESEYLNNRLHGIEEICDTDGKTRYKNTYEHGYKKGLSE